LSRAAQEHKKKTNGTCMHRSTGNNKFLNGLEQNFASSQPEGGKARYKVTGLPDLWGMFVFQLAEGTSDMATPQ